MALATPILSQRVHVSSLYQDHRKKASRRNFLTIFVQHALRNPFVKGKQLPNESTDSVQKNTNSPISHRGNTRRAAPSRVRGCCDRLERDRVQLDRRDCWPTSAGIGPELRNGARRGLRRRQRHRPWPPAVPCSTSFTTDGLQGSSGGNGGLPRARGLR